MKKIFAIVTMLVSLLVAVSTGFTYRVHGNSVCCRAAISQFCRRRRPGAAG